VLRPRQRVGLPLSPLKMLRLAPSVLVGHGLLPHHSCAKLRTFVGIRWFTCVDGDSRARLSGQDRLGHSAPCTGWRQWQQPVPVSSGSRRGPHRRRRSRRR
jgi:hypothetical protein